MLDCDAFEGVQPRDPEDRSRVYNLQGLYFWFRSLHLPAKEVVQFCITLLFKEGRAGRLGRILKPSPVAETTDSPIGRVK